jgi:hypothetical protein
MNLSNLQPAEGQHNQNKRLGRGEGSEKVVLSQVTKEQNLVLVLKDWF